MKVVSAALLVTAAAGTRNATVAHDSVRLQQQKECSDVCGEDVDTSCYTECEVDLFTCYDSHVPAGGESYKSCKGAVEERYKEFGKFWNAASFVATHFNASARVQSSCGEVCGSDSICKTSCEVGMYECFDTNTPKSEDKIEACEKKVVDEHKGLVSFWGAHTSLLSRSHEMCEDACSDSACVTECEVEMYNCYDLNMGDGKDSEEKVNECQEAAITRIEESFTSSFWNVPELLAHRNRADFKARVVSAKDRQETQSKCNEVCQEHGTCATSCEKDMYKCFDEKTSFYAGDAQKCKDKAMKKYKDEQAVLPQLLASVESMAEPKAAVFLSKI